MYNAACFALALAMLVAACGEAPSAGATPEEHRTPNVESDLATVRLAPISVEKLGLQTTHVERVTDNRTRTVGGVAVVPPGHAIAVTAPLAGTLQAGDVTLLAGVSVTRGDALLRLVPFAPPDRDLHAQARRQRQATVARVTVAQARLDRTRTLVAERGASQRALEEAEAELSTARAEDEAATARLRALRRAPLAADASLTITSPTDGIVRTIGGTPGQEVAAGAPLFDIVDVSTQWIRVPVYPSELDRLAVDVPIQVARLGADPSMGERAIPVAAPPSADITGLTVDLFYALTGASTSFRPNERVVAQLPYADPDGYLAVPASCVVFDFDGGTWVYECMDDTTFQRRRVEVEAHDEKRALLRRGPAEGTCVVSVGALELLGAEFGVAH